MSLPKNIDRHKSNPSDRLAAAQRDPWSTRCAVITSAGRSAVAVIALDGPRASAILSRCFRRATPRSFSTGEIRFGVWTGAGADETSGESVVVTPIAENGFEIHCHGGPAATERILADLAACGASPVGTGDWRTPGRPLLIAEAERVLTQCQTTRTAAIAMDQVRGAMQHWATRLLDAASDTSSLDQARQQAAGILKSAGWTSRMNEPFRVVLVGPPNVGKSSLLNVLVGFDRSITLDQAGTTRDVLHAETVIDGLAIRLSDTAGLRQSAETIEKEGIDRARRAAGQADLVMQVSEPSQLADDHREQNSESWPGDSQPGDSQTPILRVLNKVDLLDDSGPTGIYDVATCAVTGDGIAQLMAQISKRLAPESPEPAAPACLCQRQRILVEQIHAVEHVDELAAKLRELIGVIDPPGEEP